MVVRAGIEPATPRFSVWCSTNWATGPFFGAGSRTWTCTRLAHWFLRPACLPFHHSRIKWLPRLGSNQGNVRVKVWCLAAWLQGNKENNYSGFPQIGLYYAFATWNFLWGWWYKINCLPPHTFFVIHTYVYETQKWVITLLVELTGIEPVSTNNPKLQISFLPYKFCPFSFDPLTIPLWKISSVVLLLKSTLL